MLQFFKWKCSFIPRSYQLASQRYTQKHNTEKLGEPGDEATVFHGKGKPPPPQIIMYNNSIIIRGYIEKGGSYILFKEVASPKDGVDDCLKDWYEDEDEDWVEGLHLVRLKKKLPQPAVHTGGLKRPPRALSVYVHECVHV